MFSLENWNYGCKSKSKVSRVTMDRGNYAKHKVYSRIKEIISFILPLRNCESLCTWQNHFISFINSLGKNKCPAKGIISSKGYSTDSFLQCLKGIETDPSRWQYQFYYTGSALDRPLLSMMSQTGSGSVRSNLPLWYFQGISYFPFLIYNFISWLPITLCKSTCSIGNVKEK